MRFVKNKRINLDMPLDLIKKIKSVENYPNSINKACELYGCGLGLLKESGLYVPLLPYRAELIYDGLNKGALIYERNWDYFGWDKMQVALLENRLAVEVLRGGFPRVPIKTGVHTLGNSGESERFISYELAGGKNHDKSL